MATCGWDYLNPDAIIDALDESADSRERDVDSKAFEELIVHYDGVAGNPDLRSIATAPGFARTRQLLPLWLEQNSQVDASAREQRLRAVTHAGEAKPGSATERRPVAHAGQPEPDPSADTTDQEGTSKRRSL